jgi:hypothetical protein
VPRPPSIADLLARDGTPFAVVAVERTTGVDLPARFTARVRTADDALLGAFDAVREVDGPEGTWIVTALDGDVRVLREGGAVVLAGPDGLELHGRVAAVIASGAP